MITLYGFTLSNYYNKVKLALLEKGVPFVEEKIHPRSLTDAHRMLSPLGKVPFIRTEDGRGLCESDAILAYLEAKYPDPALLPADPYEAAKVRELATFVDLHLELVARELYGKAFFGGEASDSHVARVRKLLDRNIPAFARLARFDPFVAGQTFTQADCAAWASLPVVALATKVIYGDDLLVANGVDWKAYSRLIGERPSAQRVTADRKADDAASKR